MHRCRAAFYFRSWLSVWNFALVILFHSSEIDDRGSVACWTDKSVREACCALQGKEDCFNKIFTRCECCQPGMDQRTLVDPLAGLPIPRSHFPTPGYWGKDWFKRNAEQPAYVQAMFAAIDVEGHPSGATDQAKWEASVENATSVFMFRFGVNDTTSQVLSFAYFKDSGSDDECSPMLTDQYGIISRMTTGLLKLAPGDFVLCVGANIGTEAVLLAKLFPGIRVIAVEPNPAAYRYLLWNIRVNGVMFNVWPILGAIGSFRRGMPRSKEVHIELCQRMDEHSECYFALSRTSPAFGSPSSADDSEYVHPKSPYSRKVPVPMYTLSNLLERFDVSSIALLTMDCEGCEWGLFRHYWPILNTQLKYTMGALHFRGLELVFTSKEELDDVLAPYFLGRVSWPRGVTEPVKTNPVAFNLSKVELDYVLNMSVSCDVFSNLHPKPMSMLHRRAHGELQADLPCQTMAASFTRDQIPVRYGWIFPRI